MHETGGVEADKSRRHVSCDLNNVLPSVRFYILDFTHLCTYQYCSPHCFIVAATSRLAHIPVDSHSRRKSRRSLLLFWIFPGS